MHVNRQLEPRRIEKYEAIDSLMLACAHAVFLIKQ